MQLRRVRTESSAIERFVAECWFPYQEELSEAVGEHALGDEADRGSVANHLRDGLESPSNRLWVALDGVGESTTPLSTTDATVAGFVRTSLRPSPRRFDWPDRLAIRDIWVREADRGSGLATNWSGARCDKRARTAASG